MSASAGYTPSLIVEGPNAVRVEANVDWVMGPTENKKLPGGGKIRIVGASTCYYGLRLGVRGAFFRDLAMFGIAGDAMGHCMMAPGVAFTGKIGLKPIEIGTQEGFALGLGSPYLDLGIRVTLRQGMFLEGFGLIGYDIRLGRVSYPYAGGGLRLVVGLMP